MEEPESTTSEKAENRDRPRLGFWGGLFRFLIVTVVVAILAFCAFAWFTKQSFESAKDTVVAVFRGFQPEAVVETFFEWKEVKATATDGNILEIATAEATEKLTRKTNLALYGKPLPLGTTESEILVPATYRFHIDLNDEWKLSTEGSRLIVVSPEVRPSLPVAFDTEKVEKKTKSGWARWDKGENLEALEKTITKRLGERAASVEMRERIEDEARSAVAKFVQGWLLEQGAWGDEEFDEIVVVFPDELAADDAAPKKATLQLESSNL